MRKTLLLFVMLAFVSFNFISCSGDDDGGDVVSNHIYGTWVSQYAVINGTHVDPTSCADVLEYKFRNNGTFTLQTFTGDDLDDCLDDVLSAGQWEYLGESNYLIYLNNVEITDSNQDMYTYHLEFEDSDDMIWRTLADYNSGANNYIKFEQ